MKPRAVIFDLFGDYVRYHGGEIRLRALLALTEAFGFGAATVRVVVTRMRDEGWLSTRRVGRETQYAVTRSCLTMLDEGRERIFGRSSEPWDGRWALVIYHVPETERRTRELLRKKLSWLGFGALAPSTWICPHDRLAAVADEFAGLTGVRIDLLTMSTAGLDADRELAMRCWELESLNADNAALIARHRPRLSAYQRGEVTGAQALVERIRLVHEYRRFPFRDPDLPARLRPAGWIGDEAHALFLDAHTLLLDPAEAHYLEVTRRRHPPTGETP
jgi:phenylacetic acid degradation operon negative regulatory protein